MPDFIIFSLCRGHLKADRKPDLECPASRVETNTEATMDSITT
jgi:hypothetical protein